VSATAASSAAAGPRSRPTRTPCPIRPGALPPGPSCHSARPNSRRRSPRRAPRTASAGTPGGVARSSAALASIGGNGSRSTGGSPGTPARQPVTVSASRPSTYPYGPRTDGSGNNARMACTVSARSGSTSTAAGPGASPVVGSMNGVPRVTRPSTPAGAARTRSHATSPAQEWAIRTTASTPRAALTPSSACASRAASSADVAVAASPRSSTYAGAGANPPRSTSAGSTPGARRANGSGGPSPSAAASGSQSPGPVSPASTATSVQPAGSAPSAADRTCAAVAVTASGCATRSQCEAATGAAVAQPDGGAAAPECRMPSASASRLASWSIDPPFNPASRRGSMPPAADRARAAATMSGPSGISSPGP
jgi:hypothetical protein